MRTKLSRAIVIAAVAATIGTMSVLPAAADWRGNTWGYRANYHDNWFARRDRDEGRYHHWFFRHHFFDFDRR
jgi:hypothetical protein